MEAMETPRKEHAWLQRLVGEWDYETEMAEPGKPPVRATGIERVRAIGGLWIQGEAQGEVPCPSGEKGTATTLITLGYDARRERFVGTFLAGIMSHLWVYDGALDASGRVLNLDAEGPSMTDEGKTARYRDSMEIASDDQRVLRASVLADDGKWHQFMTITYRRRK